MRMHLRMQDQKCACKCACRSSMCMQMRMQNWSKMDKNGQNCAKMPFFLSNFTALGIMKKVGNRLITNLLFCGRDD